jgi:glycosyltransferase involved in cell wall biosynthesis
MNILQITLGFYPAQGWGGPVKIVYQNSKELVRRGHSVTIHCTNLMDKSKKIKPYSFERNYDGIRIVYFKTWNFSWWPGTLGPIWLPGYATYLKKEIKKYDVAHLNGYRSPLSFIAAKAAKKSGVPIITQPHGTLPVIINSKIFKKLYDMFAGKVELDGIHSLVALQESERQQAIKQKIPENRIVLIPNGINSEEIEQLPEKGYFRKRIGLDSKEKMILFLARINKKKGTDMLIEAFAKIEDKACKLIIAGPDDGQLSEVKRLIKKFELEERVVLTGLLSGSDVLGAFQDADLFVLPCRTDTFPVTIMEACLVGTPMVITDRCEIAKIVNGRIGEVVPFDSKKFSDAMKRLLKDKELYQEYRSNCVSVFNNFFSVRTVVDKLENIYKSAISEKLVDMTNVT